MANLDGASKYHQRESRPDLIYGHGRLRYIGWTIDAKARGQEAWSFFKIFEIRPSVTV